MSVLLEVENLNKHFGGLHAVKNVAFSLERGEIVGILGPTVESASQNAPAVSRAGRNCPSMA